MDAQESHPPNDEEMHIGGGLRELCAGTVALCSFYYVRLMKERRRREYERQRRISRFQRSKARESLRFAVLATTRLLSGSGVSATSTAPITEWQGGHFQPSALWSTMMEKALTSSDWIESFRVTKSTFVYLCDQLRPVIEKMDSNVRHTLPAEVRLAMTLWRLGSSCEYRAIEKIFGVSHSTICKVVRDVCQAVVSFLTPKFISIPQGDVLRDTMKGFERHFGTPQLAGVIGTFHVVVHPPQERAGQYFNTKGWHSVVLQAVVDSDHCFWDLNIGSPGNLSDTQVLLTSELYESGMEGTLFPNTTYCVDGVDIPIHLLGSRSYPLLPWLMTPFSKESNPERSELNVQFSAILSVAQVAFGRLKGRWCCLLKHSDSDPSFLPTLIAACCTLHNICESRGDPFQEHWSEEAFEEELEQPSECDEDDLEPEGTSEGIRDALAKHVRAQNAGL
ncbi:protein ANTAGONIST OF LIKE HETEROCHROMATIN PROTEIN 1-like [Bufo bufo]|uniref:protein ANTAGONIST OF LIKE HETEROCHROMATIN PROTEIN 1-like n=1 Tax=Bufo bufo TaxID=8384 RepID=UPI001ABEA8EB|nr:protein ANTAGONIST OF LIKE HETEROCHROMATIN PROTEIN 1-like [Bufo bufo]